MRVPCIDPTTLLARLATLGPGTILLSGIGLGTGVGRISTQLWHQGEIWNVTTPAIDIRPTGTGDVLSAAFLYHLIAGRSAAESLQHAVAVIFELMKSAAAAGLDELEPSRWIECRELPRVERLR